MSTSRLTDRQLEQFLAARGAVDPDESAVEQILAVTRRTSQVGRPWVRPTRRTTILLLAALLLAMLVSLGITSGLIPAPWKERSEQDRVIPLAGSITNCHRPLPQGVVLTVVDQSQLTIYADGLAIRGYPAGWGDRTRLGLDGSWQQRRLSGEGMAHLIDAVTGELPDCRQFAYDGFVLIQAATASGEYSIRLGQDVLETRVTTDEERSAARDLAARLAAPQLGLADDDWLDDGWGAYLPARWELWTSTPRGREAGASTIPLASSITTPDGTTLEEFGQLATDPSLTGGRCGGLSLDEARAVAAAVNRAGAPSSAQGGWLLESASGTVIEVSLVGLLPHERACASAMDAMATPTPAPAPSLPEGQIAPLESACDYLQGPLPEPMGAVSGAMEDYRGWSVDWSFCWYPLADQGMGVASTRRPVAATRSEAQARALFGDVGFTTEAVEGRAVYLNGCTQPGETCRAAVAVPVDPHFVVISWSGGSRDTLLKLAALVIQRLADAGTGG